jgi:hypothetical protein
VIALAISAGYAQAPNASGSVAVDLVWLFLGLAGKVRTQPHLVNRLCRSGNIWNFPPYGLQNLDAHLGIDGCPYITSDGIQISAPESLAIELSGVMSVPFPPNL